MPLNSCRLIRSSGLAKLSLASIDPVQVHRRGSWSLKVLHPFRCFRVPATSSLVSTDRSSSSARLSKTLNAVGVIARWTRGVQRRGALIVRDPSTLLLLPSSSDVGSSSTLTAVDPREKSPATSSSKGLRFINASSGRVRQRACRRR